MVGMRWGKISGKYRGGARDQARKCEKPEGKDAAKADEGETVRNRGILRSRCAKTSVVNDALIKVKSNPLLDRKGLQEDGVMKEMVSRPNPSSNNLPKAAIIKKTDFCDNGVDNGFSNKIRTKSNLSNKRVGFLRTVESSEKGGDAEVEEKVGGGHFVSKGVWGVKQGVPENELIECAKKDTWDVECMKDVKKGQPDIESREDAVQGNQESEGANQAATYMQHRISKCTQLLHVGLHVPSVQREKKAHSLDGSVDAICTDKKNSVTFDKAEGIERRRVDVHEARDADDVTLTPCDVSIGLNSMSSKTVQCEVCNAEVEEENDDVYEDTLLADADLVMVPHDFMCGISKKVMQDPVVIASGQTFERAFIQAWLDEGNTFCPVTRKPLAHLQLIPNLTLKDLISSWYLHSHGSDAKSTQHSFLSCESSLSSQPSLTTTQPHSLISDSSLSESVLSGETELYSSSSSSSSSLPKLLKSLEYDGFSSSSVSVPSDGTPEHLRAAGIYNFPSPASTSSQSSSWGQGREVFSAQKIGVQSVTSIGRRWEEETTEMSKISCSHGKSTDSMASSANPLVYIISRINGLVSDLHSGNRDIQRSAAAELRLLAKDDDSKRLLIASAGALRPLVSLLWSQNDSAELDATTALLNLSLSDSLKDRIVKEGAIEALVRVLREGQITTAKENAAVTLASLAMSEENRCKIGSANAVEPLVSLLERGSPRGRKDAATALYRLSSNDENKKRVVRAGATRLLVDCMSKEGNKDGMVDKAMAILKNLVSVEEGRVAFVSEGGVSSVMQILPTGSSKQSTSLAVAILLQLCTHSSRHRLLVMRMDPLPILMELFNTGSTRVKSQIAEVLQVLIVDDSN